MINSSWQKSVLSEPNGGNCVEIQRGPDGVRVRDTKLGPDSPVLYFTDLEWECHLLAVKGGQHDLPDSDRVSVLAAAISALSDVEMLELSATIKTRTMELLLRD
jgi:hypothetical protein